MFLTEGTATMAKTTIATVGTTKMLCHPNAVTTAPHTTGASAGPNVIMQLPIDR